MAAARRLARTGGAAFTMGEVAARAGLSRATLYRSFASRSVLLQALRREGVAVAEVPDPESRTIDAVERVLLRGGFEAFTMEAVATEAGVSLATLYRCFGDRVGLLRAFAQRRSRRAAVRAHLELPIASEADLEAALVAFTETALGALEEGRALFRLVFAAPDEIRDVLRRVRDAPRGTVAALARFLAAEMEAGRLRRDDAGTLAAAYMGQLVSFAVLFPGSGEAVPARPQLARTLARTFLRGVLP